jgi:hypothetical protein
MGFLLPHEFGCFRVLEQEFRIMKDAQNGGMVLVQDRNIQLKSSSITDCVLCLLLSAQLRLFLVDQQWVTAPLLLSSRLYLWKIPMSWFVWYPVSLAAGESNFGYIHHTFSSLIILYVDKRLFSSYFLAMPLIDGAKRAVHWVHKVEYSNGCLNSLPGLLWCRRRGILILKVRALINSYCMIC